MDTEPEMPEVVDLVRRINAFYREHAPVALTATVEPASVQEIEEFEAVLGERLPADYRTFLRHNDVRHSFDMNFECLGMAQVAKRSAGMTGALRDGTFDDGRIEHHEREDFGNWRGGYLKRVWWSPKWVPVSEDSCGNIMCVDCDPGPAGVRYQMMNMEVQEGQGPFISEYRSFVDYLAKHLGYLEAGKYRVEESGIGVDRYL